MDKLTFKTFMWPNNPHDTRGNTATLKRFLSSKSEDFSHVPATVSKVITGIE